MLKCLEVKVGVTEPSYHSAIRCNSDSQSCYAAENRAHRLASIESPRAVRVRKATIAAEHFLLPFLEKTRQSHKLMRLPVSDES